MLLTAETAQAEAPAPRHPLGAILCDGQDADGAINQARLHILLVVTLAGSGTLVMGFLADPRRAVDRVTIEVSGQPPVDLAESGVILPGIDAHRVLGVPKTEIIAYGFVAHLRQTSADSPPVAMLRLRGGAVLTRSLAERGDPDSFVEMIGRAPIGFALAAIAPLLRGCRAAGPGAAPPVIEAAAQRLFARIDPGRDDGTGGGPAAALCHVDSVLRVGDRGLLLKGWLLVGPDQRLHSLSLVSLAGDVAPIPLPMPRLARPDVIGEAGFAAYVQDRDCGFVVFAPIDGLAAEETRWFVEVRLASGAIRRSPLLCGPAPAPMPAIRAVIALAEAGACDFSDLFRRAIAPAADWFWSRLRAERPRPVVEDYGPQPTAPRASVIIPLYGRMDFIRHQIAQFSNDPDFRAASDGVELIYVLDDPAAEAELRPMCRLLRDIYRVPFRLILQKGNFGYSTANNVGARLARGSTLILLNSDVIPRQERWVTRLLGLKAQLPLCGILGCRLLFEDGSIQHAGMTFRPSLVLADAWSNEHSFKGLSTVFDPHPTTEAVAAVTGACLMIGHALYQALGGLEEGYVIGDFEDSDLCLKVHEHGLKVYYTPEVALYHLERQSMRRIGRGGDDWRQSLTLLNMWKHSQRWPSLIPRIAARYDPAVAGAEEETPPPTASMPAEVAGGLPTLGHFAALGLGRETSVLPALSVPARSRFVTFPVASATLTPCESPDFAIDLPPVSLFTFDTVTLHGFRLCEAGGHLFHDHSLVDPSGEASRQFWQKVQDGQAEDIRLGADGMPESGMVEEIDATGCLILSSDEPTNFGSWIYRFLTKYLLASQQARFDRVFAYDDGRWMRPVLALVNPAVEILPQDTRRSYRLRHAQIPSLPAPHVFFRPELIEAFAALSARIGTPPGLPERIYVSRRKQAQQGGLRVMENETELVETLKAHGFAEFMPEDHPLELQIAVFTQARVIVSPGGSNLFGAAFARHADFILDIESAPTWLYAHMNLLGSTGRPFSVIRGTPTGRGGPIHANWRVDADAVIRGLQRLGVIGTPAA